MIEYLSRGTICLVMICAVNSLSADNNFKKSDQCQFIRDALSNERISRFVIPDGTYTCASPVVVNRNGFQLIGKHSKSVILRLADNVNSPLLVLGNIETPPEPVTGLVIQGITLDGNRKHQQGECWGGDCDGGGLSVIRNNSITIRGVRGMTSDGLVYAEEVEATVPKYSNWGAIIKDVVVVGARSGGIVTEKGCTRLYVENLEAMDNHFDGFAGYQTKHSLFRNFDLHDNVNGAGISIDINFNENIFEFLKIRDNHDVGIFMRFSDRNQFIDLLFDSNLSHGLFIAQVDKDGAQTCARNNEFKNITFISPIDRDPKFRDVFIADACEGNQIVNPRVFKKLKDGTSVQTSLDYFEKEPNSFQIFFN